MMRQRGDTIVEVMVAFAVFTLVAVGTTTVMNKGVAYAERGLEVSLVREQIDAQADMLRFAQMTKAPAWTSAKATTFSGASVETCPATPPTGSFIMNIDAGSNLAYQRVDASAPSGVFQAAPLYSKVTLGGSPLAQGIWIVPVSAGTNTYDFHIRACWYTPGSSRPETLGTIVRLYDR